MAHEIIRQAVLAAARDAGAVVHDAVVGDNVPAPDAPADLEVGSFFPANREPLLILARRSEKGRKVLATFELGKPRKDFIDYTTLVERAEAVSRSKDGVPKLLEQAGLKRAAASPVTGSQPGEDVERRLSRLTFAEQFAAVRMLHAEIRDHGESPERLGALARGYANLSVLTEFHWGSRQKALKARALLAAQRLVARDPRSPVALWHRAYARALVGFHKDALDDLAVAGPPGPAAPRWVPLIDGLCRFQTDKLIAAGKGPDGQLAMLLAFLSFEESVAGVPRVVSLGQEVLDANPECYRVHAKLGRTGGVASWHVTTLAGLETMNHALPDRLKQLPGLPEAVGKRLADGAAEPDVVKSLVAAAPDQGEPSWASLGRMVADTRFALVYLRTNFMKNYWNVPVDEFLDQVWPLVADHPYHAALAAMRLNPQNEVAKYTDLLKTIEIPDIGYNEYPFSLEVGMADIERHRHLNTLINCHGDMIYRDLTAAFGRVFPDKIAAVAHDLLERSPYAPLAKMRLAQRDWAFAEPHAREWEESAGVQPDIIFGLGSQYVDLKRWDDAVRCFTKAAEMSNDVSAYQTLAAVYKAKGDIANWEKTLEKARGMGDVALGQVSVEVDLANHYMRQKQWDKALPHAKAAAATWAGAGLICAAHCYEGRGDWTQAELWQRRNTERYPDGAWMGWYVFCKRTGHGDLATARKFATDYIATYGDKPADQVLETIGIFRLLDGSPREALDLFQRRFKESHFPYSGIMAAVLCDNLGNTSERDRVLGELAAMHVVKEENLDPLVKVIRDGLGAGRGRIDSKALVAAINEAPEHRRYVMSVFAARLLHAHGDPAKASDILRQTIEMGGHEGWAQALASIWRHEWEGKTQGTTPTTAK
jgi:tetratricopeptide (TPR) repeat protein